MEFENRLIMLPVNPENLVIKSKSGNKTEEIISIGDITLFGTKKPNEWSIKCFLPEHSEYPFVTTKGQFQKPDFYIDFWRDVRVAKKPVLFTVSDVGISMLASIEEVELEYVTDFVNYELQMKQYIPFAAKTIVINEPVATPEEMLAGVVPETTPADGEVTASPATAPREDTQVIPTAYTVKSGDSLWAIAKKYLGDGARYQELSTLNNISNPNLIVPGQVLQLPGG